MNRITAFLAAIALLVGAPALARSQDIGTVPGCGNGITCSSLGVQAQTLNYTVGPSGNYATLNAAFADLNKMVLQFGGNVTLTLQDGVINEPGPVNIQSSFGKQIYIQGQNAYPFTLSSVQSSSGSAGAWSYVLNLNAVTNIAVGDFLTITATSGGVNPTYVTGVWPVTNVDGVNKRVTLTTTGLQAAAASGAVAGTVTDLKSIVKFTASDGFRVWSGATAANLSNLVIEGDGSSNSGISLQDADRVFTSGTVSVANFGGIGVFGNYNSEMNSDASSVVATSGNGTGVLFETGAILDLPNLVASGNTGRGGDILNGSVLTTTTSAVFSGNGSDGVRVTQATYSPSGSLLAVTGNTGAGVNSGVGGVVNTAAPSTFTSANNGSADTTQFNWSQGFSTTGCVGIGFSIVVSDPCLNVSGNVKIAGASLRLLNASGGATILVDSNTIAETQYRDNGGTAKWEVGHRGSGNNYDFQVFDDITSKRSLSIDHATDAISLIGEIIGGTSSLSGVGLSLQNTAGTCTLTPTATTAVFSCSSDERLKSNIQVHSRALGFLDSFHVKDYTIRATGERVTGVIAQEVQKVHPDMVHEDDRSDVLRVDGVNPWELVKAIQELHQVEVRQQREIAALTRRVRGLERAAGPPGTAKH